MSHVIKMRKREEEQRCKEFLPDEIECAKCGELNEFERETCKYCEYELNKEPYYERAHLIASGEVSEWPEEDDDSANESGHTFQYAISFLIPLVGFIMGAILLTKDSKEQESAGKTCIVLSIVAIVAYWLLVPRLLSVF